MHLDKFSFYCEVLTQQDGIVYLPIGSVISTRGCTWTSFHSIARSSHSKTALFICPSAAPYRREGAPGQVFILLRGPHTARRHCLFAHRQRHINERMHLDKFSFYYEVLTQQDGTVYLPIGSVISTRGCTWTSFHSIARSSHSKTALFICPSAAPYRREGAPGQVFILLRGPHTARRHSLFAHRQRHIDERVHLDKFSFYCEVLTQQDGTVYLPIGSVISTRGCTWTSFHSIARSSHSKTALFICPSAAPYRREGAPGQVFILLRGPHTARRHCLFAHRQRHIDERVHLDKFSFYCEVLTQQDGIVYLPIGSAISTRGCTWTSFHSIARSSHSKTALFICPSAAPYQREDAPGQVFILLRGPHTARRHCLFAHRQRHIDERVHLDKFSFYCEVLTQQDGIVYLPIGSVISTRGCTWTSFHSIARSSHSKTALFICPSAASYRREGAPGQVFILLRGPHTARRHCLFAHRQRHIDERMHLDKFSFYCEVLTQQDGIVYLPIGSAISTRGCTWTSLHSIARSSHSKTALFICPSAASYRREGAPGQVFILLRGPHTARRHCLFAHQQRM
ncbi:uncharacterized protein LOC126293245 [Schistocerca gregaria]|uniref:uncharacterized protein LOC126293245 n=1 Tax=Schistocerca gregaria TaxID=7010 RepID=UPI00211DD328|nr:uncharacterized protein LOC126293245 [Schistocerca gregaria]